MLASKRELKRAALCVGVVWLIEATFLVADGEQGVLPWLRARDQVRGTSTELQQLVDRRDRLAERGQALRSDPEAIQAAAREELGMVFPGELVLQLLPGAMKARP